MDGLIPGIGECPAACETHNVEEDNLRALCRAGLPVIATRQNFTAFSRSSMAGTYSTEFKRIDAGLARGSGSSPTCTTHHTRDQMSADFYEAVLVEIRLPAEIKPGTLNRILKALGTTLSYDTYSFDRDDINPPWQSGIYAILNLSRGGSLVDAHDVVDCIIAEYPMASIGSGFIVCFSRKFFEISDVLNGTVAMDGLPVSMDELIGS